MRRPPAGTPIQSSARASVTGSQTSQSPQPETVQKAAKPQNPSTSQVPQVNAVALAPSAGSSQENDSHSGKRPRIDDASREDATNNQTPGIESIVNSQHSSAPTHQPNNATAIQVTASSTEVPQPRLSSPPSNPPPQDLPPTANKAVQEGSSGQPIQPHVITPIRDEQPEAFPKAAPPTKRRRLNPGQAAKPIAPPRQSDAQVHALLSSTEADNSVPGTNTGPVTGHAQERRTKPAERTKKSLARGKGKRREGAAGADNRPASVRTSTQSRGSAQRKARAVESQNTTNQQRLQDAAAEIVADAVEGATTGRQGRRGRGGRKAREPTPDEAEDEIIIPGTIKMADLCKDTRKGKKSDMLKALQERDKEELMKKAQAELQQLVETGERQISEGSGDPANTERAGDGSGAPVPGVNERQEDVVREVADTYVDEHGQIRINTDSLRIDRHAQAAAEREQRQHEAVVENDLSRPAFNSQTHSKREKLNSWPEDLTDEFYEALQMFGTDFGMIGTMLRKTRRAIKLKFNREERINTSRINQALLGARIAVDLDEYSRRAGKEIKETEEHEREMEEDRKKIEENAADELRAKEEQEQVRKEQAEKERAAVPDDSSGKENREAGKKGKKKRKNGEKRRSQKKGKAVAEVS